MKKIISLLVGVALATTLTGCQSWERTKKSWTSNMEGLSRTMTIYSEDGKVLRQYHGKFDLDYGNGKVKFIMDDKVHVIYIGNSSTIVIEED